MTATTTGRPPHPIRARPARTSPTRPWTSPQPPEPPRRPPGRQGDAQRPPHSASPSASSHFAVPAVTHAVHGTSRAERVPDAQSKLPRVKCGPQGRTAVVGTRRWPLPSRGTSPWPSHTPNDVSASWTHPLAHRMPAEQRVSCPAPTPRPSDVAPCTVTCHYSVTRLRDRYHAS